MFLQSMEAKRQYWDSTKGTVSKQDHLNNYYYALCHYRCATLKTYNRFLSSGLVCWVRILLVFTLIQKYVRYICCNSWAVVHLRQNFITVPSSRTRQSKLSAGWRTRCLKIIWQGILVANDDNKSRNLFETFERPCTGKRFSRHVYKCLTTK